MPENANSHILESFDNNMKKLETLLDLLSEKAQAAIKKVHVVIKEEDIKESKKIVKDDKKINLLEAEINDKGTEIIMRYAPVASDLRTVLSAFRISSDFERIGDEASNIAKRIKRISKVRTNIEDAEIDAYFNPVFSILEKACMAYSRKDVELAKEVILADKKIDGLYKKSVKDLTNNLNTGVDGTKKNIELAFLMRSLERVGDHACNIAEDVIYLKTGKNTYTL